MAPFYRPGSDRALLGGDFYDVVQTSSGVHLLIGDVSGHGPDEAALGVALRIAWRALILAGLTTPDVLRGVERVLLAERNDNESFATVAMASLNPSFTRADVVLCGHPRPLVIRGDDVRELDMHTYPMLTSLPDAAIEPTAVDLADEWALLLFTDGLVEGRSAPGVSERLGVTELVRRLGPLLAERMKCEELAPTLVTAAEQCNGGPLIDDVAVLLVGNTEWWR